MSKELKISDAEYIFAENTLLAYLTAMVEAETEFQKVIGAVLTHALEDPVISIKLGNLSEKMSAIAEKTNRLVNGLTGESHDFITDIDEKDQFIY